MNPGPKPLFLHAPDMRQVDPRVAAAFEELTEEQTNLARLLSQNAGKIATLSDTSVVHHLDDKMAISDVSKQIRGDKNVGAIFFETTNFKNKATQNVDMFDVVIAGSSWNGQVLLDNGIENVATVLQGVDTAIFNIGRKKKTKFADRFVVFSGGKLEFRKGQDILLQAFMTFQKRHADALLMTMWHSPWPSASNSLKLSPYVDTPPKIDKSGRQCMTEWVVAAGLPENAFIDLGEVPHNQIPSLLKHVDVAAFPNRCEGGTNLVAMECLSMGVPCVLSANTGHLDLLDDERCYALTDQKSIKNSDESTQGWGESSVEELVAVLEDMYQNYHTAKRKGEAAADWMKHLSWALQAQKYKTIIAG